MENVYIANCLEECTVCSKVNINKHKQSNHTGNRILFHRIWVKTLEQTVYTVIMTF